MSVPAIYDLLRTSKKGDVLNVRWRRAAERAAKDPLIFWRGSIYGEFDESSLSVKAKFDGAKGLPPNGGRIAFPTDDMVHGKMIVEVILLPALKITFLDTPPPSPPPTKRQAVKEIEPPRKKTRQEGAKPYGNSNKKAGGDVTHAQLEPTEMNDEPVMTKPTRKRARMELADTNPRPTPSGGCMNDQAIQEQYQQFLSFQQFVANSGISPKHEATKRRPEKRSRFDEVYDDDDDDDDAEDNDDNSHDASNTSTRREKAFDNRIEASKAMKLRHKTMMQNLGDDVLEDILIPKPVPTEQSWLFPGVEGGPQSFCQFESRFDKASRTSSFSPTGTAMISRLTAAMELWFAASDGNKEALQQLGLDLAGIMLLQMSIPKGSSACLKRAKHLADQHSRKCYSYDFLSSEESFFSSDKGDFSKKKKRIGGIKRGKNGFNSRKKLRKKGG